MTRIWNVAPCQSSHRIGPYCVEPASDAGTPCANLCRGRYGANSGRQARPATSGLTAARRASLRRFPPFLRKARRAEIGGSHRPLTAPAERPRAGAELAELAAGSALVRAGRRFAIRAIPASAPMHGPPASSTFATAPAPSRFALRLRSISCGRCSAIRLATVDTTARIRFIPFHEAPITAIPGLRRRAAFTNAFRIFLEIAPRSGRITSRRRAPSAVLFCAFAFVAPVAVIVSRTTIVSERRRAAMRSVLHVLRATLSNRPAPTFRGSDRALEMAGCEPIEIGARFLEQLRR
jgi:hypothetical protein